MVRVNVIASEPGMFETFLSADSRCSILVQHLAYQIFRRVRDRGPVCWVESQRLFQHITEDFLVVISFEGRVPAEEDEKDNTETPHIAALVIVALEDLGCDVVRCSHNCMHFLDFLLLSEAFGQTEVDQLDFRVICRVVH